MQGFDLIQSMLYGTALGDALGEPLEHETKIQPESFDAVLKRPQLYITDDTQMTLFLAEKIGQGKHSREALTQGLFDWYSTRTIGIRHALFIQLREYQYPEGFSNLLRFESLFQTGVPGATCMAALRELEEHGVRPANNSKGNGTVMRASPMVFYSINRLALKNKGVDWKDLIQNQPKITHDHPFASDADYVLISVLHGAYDDPSLPLSEHLAQAPRYGLVSSDNPVLTFVREALFAPHPHAIGGGWVAEEALAIALWAAHRANGNFINGIRGAVCHDGDSDTTGAIAGAIMAAQGLNLPADLIDRLHAKDAIDSVAALFQNRH